MFRPFALKLYELHLGGKTAQQLSEETGIPLDRIEVRLRVAELYLNMERSRRQERRAEAGTETMSQVDRSLVSQGASPTSVQTAPAAWKSAARTASP